jgi:DNA-binding CsgD family transcriptional regulator
MLSNLLFDVMDDFEDLSGTADLERLFTHLAIQYGLSSIAYLATGVGRGKDLREPIVVTTYSPAWIERYKAQDYVAIDPVVQMGMRRILPVDWSDFRLLGQQIHNFFGEATEFGVGRQGLSIPVHGRYGDRGLFSVTCDLGDRAWRNERRIYMRDFQVLAVHLHAMLLRLEVGQIEAIPLSPRERECLRWIAEGKTAWECAVILGLSVNTVRCYLESARYKLAATSNTHAVAKAIKADLLSTIP